MTGLKSLPAAAVIVTVAAALHLASLPAAADDKQDILNEKFEKEIEIRHEQARHNRERFERLERESESFRREIESLRRDVDELRRR